MVCSAETRLFPAYSAPRSHRKTMVARDDSVIRGSFIACMIFLVLSICLNFFLWLWGDTQAGKALEATDRLSAVQTEVAQMKTQSDRMKNMLGRGGFTQAEIDEMKKSATDDADMQAIEEQFAKDMSYFGPEVEPQNRNYPALPDYLANAIRDRNEQYGMARDEATQIRTDADADIANARKQQQLAEAQRDDTNKKLVTQTAQFDEDRARMNKEKEDTKDQLVAMTQDFNVFRRAASERENQLVGKTRQMQGTIDTQKNELVRMRSDNFETTQGEIRYVVDGGNVTMINLGSADALRPGVTFGVIDADETRLEDAKVKATIQVTQIEGAHLARARVVAKPEIRYPIIPGDKIYSPFWSPGRQVKIALAGDIDIDGDDRPDNEALKGQIKAAGAEVAAEVQPTGAGIEDLDASIRFVVVGEGPELSADETASDADAQQIAALGRVKQRASELGLTIIPAWKLQNYLRTIDDSLTTPLGSAVRGDDFPAETVSGTNRRLPSDLSDLYKSEPDRIQKDNKILKP